MPIKLFYAFDLLLPLSCAVALRLRNSEQRVSLSLIQILAALPLLAAQYLYCAIELWSPATYLLLFFTEGLFGLVWLTLAVRLSMPPVEDTPETPLIIWAQFFTGAALIALTLYFQSHPPDVQSTTNDLVFAPYRYIYFHALALLLAMLATAWRLETFWRRLTPSDRWAYKFLIMGCFLATAALIWAGSYRLTYQRLATHHLALLAALAVLSWLLIVYAVARHRLLNRKIFISRKIIYSFVAPTIFAAYLFTLGVIGLIMRAFGLTLPFLLQWLAFTIGLLAVAIFLFSPGLRRRVHFFISTHFYINKYEYRDEWLALSIRLQNAATERDVVVALYDVLSDSLYATHITIWIGDSDRGYIAIPSQSPNPHTPDAPAIVPAIIPNDPLVQHLKTHPYFYIDDNTADTAHRALALENKALFESSHLVLLAPLQAGEHLVGIIGLGREFTGGRYGQDDFDLLAALGTQTASALMAVRMAEKLANARERQAWHRLSAFVLHDIKNAAAMLSLVRANAPANIHNPDFQQDMLEAMDDALARMGKVQTRLDMLKEEIVPEWSDVEIHQFLDDCCKTINKRLKGMAIDLSCPPGIHIQTDPNFLSRIVENLLINAFEAGGQPPAAHVRVDANPPSHQVTICIEDNGPGIDQALLPEALFQPLKTTKANGSGIGLWQVKQLVTNLNGTIHAENIPDGGAAFTIQLPK